MPVTTSFAMRIAIVEKCREMLQQGISQIEVPNRRELAEAYQVLWNAFDHVFATEATLTSELIRPQEVPQPEENPS